MKMTRETVYRALRTFIQAALAYFAVHIAAADFSGENTAVKTVLIGLAVSSLSAGIAAVMNLEREETEFDE